MALKKSNMALGITPVPSACSAGEVIVQRARYPFKAAVASGDIIEIGVLPAYHYLVSAQVVAGGATVGTIGILSGKPDDADDGRTLGPAIVTSGALNATGLLMDAVDYDRGIGVTMGANVAAGANEMALILTYAQG